MAGMRALPRRKSIPIFASLDSFSAVEHEGAQQALHQRIMACSAVVENDRRARRRSASARWTLHGCGILPGRQCTDGFVPAPDPAKLLIWQLGRLGDRLWGS